MHNNQDVLKTTIAWLEREMSGIEYGDLGIVFTFSKGEITKIKKVNEESVPVKKEVKK